VVADVAQSLALLGLAGARLLVAPAQVPHDADVLHEELGWERIPDVLVTGPLGGLRLGRGGLRL